MFPEMKSSFLPKIPGNAPAAPLRVLPGAVSSTFHANSSHPATRSGLFTGIGFLILIAVVISAGGTIVYNRLLVSNVSAITTEISGIEKKIDLNTLQEIGSFNARVDAAGTLLENHQVVSRLFTALNIRTLKTVQFDTFDFKYAGFGSAGAEQTDFTEVSIDGSAKSYNAIAQQSESFALEPILQRHIFSDFHIDDKNSRIQFSLTIIVPNDLIHAGIELPKSSEQTDSQQSLTTPTETTTSSNTSSSDDIGVSQPTP